MPAFMGKPWAAPHDLSKHVAPSSSASRQTDVRTEWRAKHRPWTRLKSRKEQELLPAWNGNRHKPKRGRDRVPPQALWKRSRQHEPRKVPGHGAPPIGVVLQQVNTYRRNHLPSGASPERGCPPQTEASSQAPANKKRLTRRRFSSGTDHGCREPITSSSWVRPSSPSGGLPGGASIRPGRFPRCRCAPVPAGECRTPGGPSRGPGSAG